MTQYTVVNKKNKFYDGHYTHKKDALEVAEYFKELYPNLSWEVVERDKQVINSSWLRHRSDEAFAVFCKVLPANSLADHPSLGFKFQELQTRVLDILQSNKSVSILDFAEGDLLADAKILDQIVMSFSLGAESACPTIN